MIEDRYKNKVCLVNQKVNELISQIDQLSNNNKFFYLNIFNVDRNASQQEIENLFENGLVHRVIPIGQDGVVYDLEFTNKMNLYKVAQQRSFNLRNREIYIRNSIKNNRHQGNKNNNYNNRNNRNNNRGYNRDQRTNRYQNNNQYNVQYNNQYKRTNYNNNNVNTNQKYQQRNKYNRQDLHLSRKGQDFNNKDTSFSSYKNKDNQQAYQDKKKFPDQKPSTGLTKVTDNEYVIVDNKSNKGVFKQRNYQQKFPKRGFKNNTEYVKKKD